MTCRPPTGIQVKKFSVTARWRSRGRRGQQPGQRDAGRHEGAGDASGADPPGQRVAEPPADQRRAPRTRRAGSNGMRNAAWTTDAQPFSEWRSSAVVLARRRKMATTMPEADDDLGRRHHQDEEHDRLAADVAEHPGEGHEGQVGGVQHQLDAHEHDQHVAPDQQADGADGEQHGRQAQVPRRRGWLIGPSSSAIAGDARRRRRSRPPAGSALVGVGARRPRLLGARRSARTAGGPGRPRRPRR